MTHSLRSATSGAGSSERRSPSPSLPPPARKGILRKPGSAYPVKGVRFGDDNSDRELQSLKTAVRQQDRWIPRLVLYGLW